MTKIELLQQWNYRVWNQQERGAIADLMTDDAIIYGLGKQIITGPAAFAEFHAKLCRLFAVIEIDVLQTMEQGNWISSVCEARGEAAKTGKVFSISGAMYCKVINGQFVEVFNLFDFLGLFAQMELLPADALALGLSGFPISELETS